jgi:hypothetical protein
VNLASANYHVGRKDGLRMGHMGNTFMGAYGD